jgi:hypothetical protein
MLFLGRNPLIPDILRSVMRIYNHKIGKDGLRKGVRGSISGSSPFRCLFNVGGEANFPCFKRLLVKLISIRVIRLETRELLV